MLETRSILSILLALCLFACEGGTGTVTNTAPKIDAVLIERSTTDDFVAGDVLTVSYLYSDNEGDLEGASNIQWLRNGVPIAGEQGNSYKLTDMDTGQVISVKINPVATSGSNGERWFESDEVLVKTYLPPALNSLELVGAKLTQPFDPSITAYNVEVHSLYSQVQLLVEPQREMDIVNINGEYLAKGDQFNITDFQTPIELNVESVVSLTNQKYSLNFSSDNSIFKERAKIRAPDFAKEYNWKDRFDIDEDTLVTFVEGDALVYERDVATQNWVLDSVLTGDNNGVRVELGIAIAIDGDTLAVSSIDFDAVYIFVKHENQWSQLARLVASNIERADQFGVDIAIDGNYLVVGARQEFGGGSGVNPTVDNNSLESSGAAYVFVRENGSWKQQAYLKASNPDVLDRFGTKVTISGDTIAVSATYERSGAVGVNSNMQSDNSVFNAGAVYVFKRTNNLWSQQAYIKAHNTKIASDHYFEGQTFGHGLALSGDTLAVGAPFESSASAGINPEEMGSDIDAAFSGAVYIFKRNSGVWRQQAYLKGVGGGSRQFGYSVALEHDILVVGADHESSVGNGLSQVYWPIEQTEEEREQYSFSGAAYIYSMVNEHWKLKHHIKAINATAWDMFGSQVEISNGTVAISSITQNDEDENDEKEIGAIYTFSDGPLDVND